MAIATFTVFNIVQETCYLRQSWVVEVLRTATVKLFCIIKRGQQQLRDDRTTSGQEKKSNRDSPPQNN